MQKKKKTPPSRRSGGAPLKAVKSAKPKPVRPMMDVDVDALKQVVAVQSHSYEQWRMFAYIVRQLKAQGLDVKVDNGNIYCKKGAVGAGEAYPCMVAHMDTVHRIIPSAHYKVMEMEGDVFCFNSKLKAMTGCGGDDKVGIFIALEMLKKHDVFAVAFFRDEEVGCVGSGVADMTFFQDVAYVLQCDRRGNDEWIVNAAGTELSSDAFQKRIEPVLKQHGYRTSYGSVTDVMELKDSGLSVCAANIGCGYHNPHSSEEYINIEDVAVCMSVVDGVITTCGRTAQPHVYNRPVYSGYNNSRSFNSTTDYLHTPQDLTWMLTNSSIVRDGLPKGSYVRERLETYGITNDMVKYACAHSGWLDGYRNSRKKMSASGFSVDYIEKRLLDVMESLEFLGEMQIKDAEILTAYVSQNLLQYLTRWSWHDVVSPEVFVCFGTAAFDYPEIGRIDPALGTPDYDETPDYGKYGLCLDCLHRNASEMDGLCDTCRGELIRM